MSTQAVRRLDSVVLMTPASWGPVPAQDWHINGKAGTNPGAHFVGTTANTALVLRTNGIPRSRWSRAAPIR